MIGFFLKRWLLSNLSRLLGWGAAAFSVCAVLLGARQAGKKAEQIQQLKKTLEVKNAQLRAQIDAPRSRSELIDWLRQGKF